MTSIKDLHHDYLLLTQMKIPIKRKIRLLTELFGETDNPWRVVGITESALSVFRRHDFKKIRRMGINRSHIVDRKISYTFMLENIFADADRWWEYYFENDRTVLSTSSENMSSQSSKIIYFENDDLLFKSSGFTWSYGPKEKTFLKELAKIHIQT